MLTKQLKTASKNVVSLATPTLQFKMAEPASVVPNTPSEQKLIWRCVMNLVLQTGMTSGVEVLTTTVYTEPTLLHNHNFTYPF